MPTPQIPIVFQNNNKKVVSFQYFDTPSSEISFESQVLSFL